MLTNLIEKALFEAIRAARPDVEPHQVSVVPCQNANFGDYQTNSIMALAKRHKTNPRQLATEVMEHLNVSDWCEPPTIAGAGFINFRLKPDAVSAVLSSASRGEHLFYSKTDSPKRFVIDFSSPNVAKPMHVGHIRSTILGACLTRLLRLRGHVVITDNHIGDWGTQFGKLIVGWKRFLDRAQLDRDPIAEMERIYKHVNSLCEEDQAVLESARQELVNLQSGDDENLEIWRQMIELSRHQFDEIYQRLGVDFDHTLGESFYNARLKGIVDGMLDSGLAEPSQGAVVVFFPE